jgi:hypothetical protein
VELVEDKLFVKLAKAGGGWLWHNDRIDKKLELVPGCCFGGFVGHREKGRMRSIIGGHAPTA